MTSSDDGYEVEDLGIDEEHDVSVSPGGEVITLGAGANSSANGTSGRRNPYEHLTPSQLKLLMGDRGAQGGGSGFDLVEQLLKGSVLPEDYLARADINEVDIYRLQRLTIEMSEAEVGYIDEPHLMWVWLTTTTSRDRRSREEAVQVATAQQLEKMSMRQRAMERLSQFRNDNPNRELG